MSTQKLPWDIKQQILWIVRGYLAHVCRGWEEAATLIAGYLDERWYEI
jgi:hypothetical protein